ncbi:MAG: hypothetical protein JJU02_02005 [Cryomorphaceae bacterium]|nr:hypothetical protein [Cryomorphaceae bacterium]
MQNDISRNRQSGIVTFPIRFAVVMLWTTLLLFGCHKNEIPPKKTKVYGHLIVRGTEEIINDRPYKLGVTHMRGSEVLVDTITDESGYFELSFEPESDESVYWLRYLDEIPDETFWEDGAWMELDSNEFPSNWQSFGAGYHGEVNMAVTKKAWVELHVENVTPQIGDRIRIRFRGGWEHVFRHGQNFKVILPGSGNVPNRLDIWVSKPGVDPHLQTKWIQLGEMDTTYFKLEY